MAKPNHWHGDQIQEHHIREAAKLWNAEKDTLRFGNSVKYDVYIDGKPYPPKAICALAYKLATQKELTPDDFPGAKDGYWHKILSKYFPIHAKDSTFALDAKVDDLTSMQDTELFKKAIQTSADKPKAITVSVKGYERSPYVRAAALRRAKGMCQGDSHTLPHPAPFKKRSTGEPYLEVHHIIPLSRGGADTLENTIALCPNCHAKRHDELTLARDDD